MDDASERELSLQEFFFKDAARFKLGEPWNNINNKIVNLLVISNKFGFMFIGSPDGVLVVHSRTITSCTSIQPVSTLLTVDAPTHLALSCDELTLSVVTQSTDTGLQVAFYDLRIITSNNKTGCYAFVQLSREPESLLADLHWNPGTPNVLACCLDTGYLVCYQISDDAECKIVGASSIFNVTAMCWSPKGKQLVVGTNSGNLIQVTPNLETKRTFGPPGFEDQPVVRVTDVFWVSTYTFVAGYSPNESPTDQPYLFIVTVPKATSQLVAYPASITTTTTSLLLLATL